MVSSDFPLSYYIDRAMEHATYELLEPDSLGGRIPVCPGVVAFGKMLKECRDELQSTLEDWMLIGFKLGHRLSVIDGVDLNIRKRVARREAV